MNWKRLLLTDLLLAFVIFSVWAFAQVDPGDWLAAATANWIAVQVSFDLVIALSMVLVWIVGDARKRGVSPWPYVVATLFLGSIAPLTYLVVRMGGRRRQALAATPRPSDVPA